MADSSNVIFGENTIMNDSGQPRPGSRLPGGGFYVEVQDPTRSWAVARTECVDIDDNGDVVRISGYVYPQGTIRRFDMELPGIRGIAPREIGVLVAAALLDYTTRQQDAGLGYGTMPQDFPYVPATTETT